MTYGKLRELSFYIYQVAHYRCRQQGNKIPSDNEALSRHNRKDKIGFAWDLTPEGRSIWRNIDFEEKNCRTDFYACDIHNSEKVNSTKELTYGQLRELDPRIYKRAKYLCSNPSRIKDSDSIRQAKYSGGFSFVDTEEGLSAWSDLAKHDFRSFYVQSYKQKHNLTLSAEISSKKSEGVGIINLEKLFRKDKYAALTWVTRAREQGHTSIALTSNLHSLVWRDTAEGHNSWMDIITEGNFTKFYEGKTHIIGTTISGLVYLYHLKVFCPEAYYKAYKYAQKAYPGKLQSQIDQLSLGGAFNWTSTPEGMNIWDDVESGNFTSFLKYYEDGDTPIETMYGEPYYTGEPFPQTTTSRITAADVGLGIILDKKEDHQVLVKLNKPKKRIKL
jgi:hypothetical protein